MHTSDYHMLFKIEGNPVTTITCRLPLRNRGTAPALNIAVPSVDICVVCHCAINNVLAPVLTMNESAQVS